MTSGLENAGDIGGQIRSILAKVKPLAVEYYKLTGKPLGVTGEIAEFIAADLLGLTLVPPRMTGYDALRGSERIQIKGRAYEDKANRSQRMGRIKLDAPCDTVMLVLLDSATLEPRAIWEAPYSIVVAALIKPGSRARERGQLGVPTFMRLQGAKQTWIRDTTDPKLHGC